jgi:hypothetical protein
VPTPAQVPVAVSNPGQKAFFPSANIILALIPQQQLRIPGAKENDMLWTIFVVLLILWLLGFSLHVGGSLIHLVLVIAVVVLIYNLITGRRAL